MSTESCFLAGLIPALQSQIKSAKLHAKDATFLAALLAVVIAVLALMGMLRDWATEILLMEISFFHLNGAGRPPQAIQVQSIGPGFAFDFQLQS